MVHVNRRHDGIVQHIDDKIRSHANREYGLYITQHSTQLRCFATDFETSTEIYKFLKHDTSTYTVLAFHAYTATA